MGLAFLTLGYGSVLADIDSLLADVEPIQEAMEEIGGDTLARSFASFALVVVAVLASIHVVLGALRPRAEEVSGRVEALLAAPLSRLAWLGGHAAVVLVGGAVVMASAGLVFGLSGAASTGDPSLAGDLAIASLAYLPALWVVAGITLALYGWFPRAAALAWVVPVHGFVVGYLGQLLDLPDWLRALSPLGHVPRVPAEPWSWTAWVITAVVASALLAVAVTGFTRRDLTPSS